MPLQYYGTSGPKFDLLKGNNAERYATYSISAARRQEGNPWTRIATVNDDINFITRERFHGYRYEQIFYFENVKSQTELENLLTIANWTHDIRLYPAADQTLINFRIKVIDATPYEWTDLGYTAFRLHVRSVELLPRIPSVDAADAVNTGYGINQSFEIV